MRSICIPATPLEKRGREYPVQALGSVMILLISNYPFDEQESMRRFAEVLQSELRKRGLDVETISPQPFFGRLRRSGNGLGKWLGYLDKFVLFPFVLRRKLARCDLAHICDHSNAFYGRHLKHVPWLITCHDLLAVRGALGEPTDCPASPTGKILQRWILRGLSRAPLIACVSTATRDDALRLLAPRPPPTRVILQGLNHGYKRLAPETRDARLEGLPELRFPFVLLVGSNQRRKNREGALRIFQKVSAAWDARLVFAGQVIPDSQLALADELGIRGRIISLVKPGNDLLEALYSKAIALLFPSTSEGFGWPVIEAQACGCPVVCSDVGPLPEVAGDAALIRPVEDEDGFAADILSLRDPAEREKWAQKGLENARRFTTDRMMDEYIQAYSDVAKKEMR